MQLIEHSDSPRYIRLHERDNVVIVVNDQGVPAGTEFSDGLVTVDFVPQSHKVTLEDIPEGGQVIRYGQTIGYALQPIPRGSWVKEDQLRMPTAPPLDSLPLSTEVPAAQAPLEGLYLRGLSQRRRHGRHAQHSGHHHHGAVRDRRAGSCGQAHQGRTAAQVPARR